ncbi:MAG: peptidyl-prolyl cis-trans isomerase [Acidobacteriota bacterium]
MIAGKEAVASVNGEPITVDELLRQIGTLHAGVAESRARKPDTAELLNRVIKARLILQEAKRIGVDRLPEVTSKAEKLRMGLVKNLLVREQVGGITEGDPVVVEKLYRDAVRELSIDSLLFEKEQDAASFSAALKAGGDFKALAGETIATGKARGGAGAQSMKPAGLRPEVAKVIALMQPGEISAPIRLTDGWTIVRLLDIRYPEDREARRQARQDGLEARKQARLEEFMDVLRKRYTTVDRPLLAGLDFDSGGPGLEKLRRDERVVAQVKGGAPVRVKDLTAGIEKKYYHGVEGAIERKRVNEDLPQILDRILVERATLLEAKRLNLERTDSFKAALQEQTDGVLFDAFVTKVINPEVKLESAELKKHYDEHAGEYTTPEMMRIESLAFRRYDGAQAAIDKLRQGADMKWMRANADGQAGRDWSASLLEFKGDLVATAALPGGVRKAVAGARAGDCRFSGEPGGPFYVLCIRQVVAASPQPYDSVKNDIATKLFVLKRQAAVEDWAAKLRAASIVKVFASGQVLSDLLGLGPQGGA